MSEQTNNKTIAKNTIFLYFRMMFTMLVSLYTSRVILDVLGVNDYGIYQAVGGVVSMLSFVNAALANGTSRFITFELGTGNVGKLKKTFSTLLWANIGLAVIVVLFAETIGLWFVSNKMVIPVERMDAAMIVYHLSIVTCFFQLVLVPYNASIIAHERMNIYAYISIVDVVMRLVICYMLNIEGFDRLVIYASLLCLIQILLVLFYIFYCLKRFSETRFSKTVDKSILKDVVSYSSWSLIAASSTALKNQGATILVNIFFSPAVVSARAIANQVNMAANQFIQNFRTAANPQIVKKYAMGDTEGSKRLLLSSTVFSFYLMLALALPICLVADDLLGIWLKEVPEYTTVFLQLAIVTSLFQVFDTSFYTALYAKGRIKENALTAPTLGMLMFPIVYVLFKFGCSPVVLAWALLCLYAVLGCIQKPILMIKIANYQWSEIIRVFIKCLKVVLISCPIPIALYCFRDILFSNVLIRFFGLSLISLLFVLVTVWAVGIDKAMRKQLISFVMKKVKNVSK